MKTSIVIESQEVETVAQLREFLEQFSPETKIHGAFDDPLILSVIFYPDFGIKTISFE